ncbi:hypothetical protein HOF65_05190 [bacterium]|nr:hypothetical protein [bacterium]MBT3853348.1 hypothetical protein [bacterium]MBT6779171.1 hypothetical protein [bacterium]
MFIVAGFFQPVAVSPFSPGGVSVTSSMQLGSKLILIGLQLNSCNITLSQSCINNSDQSSAAFLSSTCSKVVLFIKK